ncbi:hypothetical protein [Streptomyces sp. NBRC 110035]|uniref:hypothetical protein n=1 Tax=Streptomyces sp. NBRC 110035 TaxID=1547867 RepID=UPI0005A98BCF|nr:hypothetical protein [Streptomyces sp. NBRC 110035]
MATMHVNSLILICDGCEKPLKDGETFQSAMEARGAAYGEGWRFPPKLSKRTGTPTKNCSDVCPDCQPGWEFQTIGEKPSGYRRQDAASQP